MSDSVEKCEKLLPHVIIMAGGPATQRPRHLRWLWFRMARVIDIPLKASMRVTDQVQVLVDKENLRLVRYLERSYPRVGILHPSSALMLDSFKCAFSYDNCVSQKVIVAGDLTDINESDIRNFCRVSEGSALPRLPSPFKKEPFITNEVSSDRVRTDVGQGIFAISPQMQRLFYDDAVVDVMRLVRSYFRQGGRVDDTSANDVWTWMLYVIFDSVYGHEHLKQLDLDTGLQELINITSNTANDHDD
jgi:hypothetical protein